MSDKPVRRIQLSLLYNAADISADVAPFLLSFNYNEYFDSKSTDEIQVAFEDKEALWRNRWFPTRGAKLTAKITCIDWPEGGVLDCGEFEIDDIQFAGPPNVCSIGALAVGITSRIRRERTTKAWENITVKGIAQEIADKNGFSLFFDSGVDPKIDRFDQREQTDMELLGALCENNGLGLKIANGKIVIFEERLYDKRSPSMTLTRGADGYISHNFRVSSSDIYTACEVQYIDPKQRLLITYRHEPGASEWSGEKPPSGYVLKLNQRCSCQADAERLAKSALRDQNKREVTGSIDYIGRPALRSGIVVGARDFGRFDQGNYLVENVTHHYDKAGGYETTAEIRGVLDY